MAVNRVVPLPVLLCPVVVGRDVEIELLRQRVDDASRGSGGVVTLVGEAGVGKTRLCREVVAIANASGFRCLAGRAVPSVAPVPYRPLTEAVVAAFRDAPPPDVPELVGFRGHLARLVPAWAAEDPGGAEESPVLLAEAVVRLLRVAAGEVGCLVVLEDLHWADSETLAVVEYLVDALRFERVVVMCTSRPTGTAADVLRRAHRHDPAALVGVHPLSEHELSAVVRACLDSDEAPERVVALVSKHSEGNPSLPRSCLQDSSRRTRCGVRTGGGPPPRS